MSSMPNVTVTPSAEKFMRRMVRFSGLGEGAGFRLVVKPGGCSGLSSEFSVEAAAQPGDAAVNVNGMSLFLPAESRVLLEGVTIDFADTVAASGLTFINPNAAACGCSSATSATASLPSGGVTVDVSLIKRH